MAIKDEPITTYVESQVAVLFRKLADTKNMTCSGYLRVLIIESLIESGVITPELLKGLVIG